MNQDEAKNRAIVHITELVKADGPPQPRVVHCEATTEWYPDILRTLSEHRLHVLGRGADLIVFFNEMGRLIGWRDDGRNGSELPAMVEREAFLKAVVAELGLPRTTRLGQLEPRKLPPLGWTHQAVLFLVPTPGDDEVLRIWADPESLKVIQSLYGPVNKYNGHNLVPDMEPFSSLKSSAADEVHELMVRRLKNVNIPSSRPDWYFQLEPSEPEPYSGGFQVRVHTWRHWSDASVQFNNDDGTLIAWRVSRYADEPAEVHLDEEQAVAVASSLVDIPFDAELETFYGFEFAPQRKLVRMEWQRIHQGMVVEGDFLRVSIHPTQHRLVEYQRKWRVLNLREGPGDMTEEEAVDFVSQHREKLDIPPELRFTSGKRAIVEFKRDREVPGKVQDRIAWILRLAGPSGWVDVHVDVTTRKVLAVIRSA